MSRSIKGFKNFEEAAADEKEVAAMLSPSERILLLHKLIRAWMKFPRLISTSDNVPVIKRMK